MISEYTLDSLMRSVIELDLVKYEYFLPEEDIDAYIEDFEHAFGKRSQVKMVLKSTPLDQLHKEYHPRIEVNYEGMNFIFRGDIHIMNPYDYAIDALIMHVQFKVQLRFTIESDFKIKLHAEDIHAEIIELDSYFKTHTTKENLNDRI